MKLSGVKMVSWNALRTVCDRLFLLGREAKSCGGTTGIPSGFVGGTLVVSGRSAAARTVLVVIIVFDDDDRFDDCFFCIIIDLFDDREVVVVVVVIAEVAEDTEEKRIILRFECVLCARVCNACVCE